MQKNNLEPWIVEQKDMSQLSLFLPLFLHLVGLPVEKAIACLHHGTAIAIKHPGEGAHNGLGSHLMGVIQFYNFHAQLYNDQGIWSHFTRPGAPYGGRIFQDDCVLIHC